MSEKRTAAELAALRREYGDRGLDTPDLAEDPIEMFGRWFDDIVEAGLHEPNAMVLTTVSGEGRPSTRMVLLKGYDERGFVFYTNYESRKGRDIDATAAAALLFPWHDVQRQVRVEGDVVRVGREESEAYFAARPREAQLGAWASPQSREVASRAELDALYAEVEQRFAGADVPLPPHWGGYRVRHELVEFWQGRKGRMHDRLVYRRAAGAEGETRWETGRLAP